MNYMLATPLAPSSAAATSIVGNLLSFAAVLAGGIVALIAIIKIAKDIVSYVKGSGGGGNASLGGIIKTGLVLLIAIGVIFLFATQWSALGEKAQKISEKGVNVVDKSTQEIIP